jgi:hypothetical protein
VMVGGKHRIMWRLNKNSPYEFSERRQRELMYAHTHIKTGEKTVYGEVKDVCLNLLAAWATHAKTRIYMGGVVFRPGQAAGDDYYNTWQGFAVAPEENKALLQGIHKHIEEVICGGKQEMIDYFYDWVAYSFQNPDVPAMSALVLRGKKGSGKGIIGHFLSKIWGSHARYINNPKHLVGNFNALLADACFLFADEAFYSGDKKHECVLKGLITESTLVIERKGVDSYNDRNHLKIMLATNEDFAVPATEDERRFCVFDVLPTYLRNVKYFDPLVEMHKSKKVQEAFLYEMLNRDISGYRPGNIPESDGLREQRMHSLCSIGKWLADYLANEEYQEDDEIGACWEEQVSTSDLHAAYINWCDTQKKGTYDRVGTIPFSKYMHEIYPKRKVGDKRLSGFHLGPLSEAIKKFEDAKKIKLDI